MDSSRKLEVWTPGEKPPMNNKENLWLRKQLKQQWACAAARHQSMAPGRCEASEFSLTIYFPLTSAPFLPNARSSSCVCPSYMHKSSKVYAPSSFSPGVYSDAKPTALVEHVWCLSIQKINALVSIFKLTVSSSLRINAIFSFQVFFWRRREFVLSWALNITLFTYAKMYLIHVIHIPLSIFDKTYSLEV